mgnify:CR=1 FL=1
MSQLVIVDGDKLILPPLFGARSVTPLTTPIIAGSGKATVNGKKIVIFNDEKKVSINATYTSPGYTQPGSGTITIQQLIPDQSLLFYTAETPVVNQGVTFTAMFQPAVPASDPDKGPDPDTAPTLATGSFQPSQNFVTVGQ